MFKLRGGRIMVKYAKWEKKIFYFSKPILNLVIIALGIYLFLNGLSDVGKEMCSRNIVTYISSLNIHGNLQGSFFLGIGSINNVEKYYFYKNVDDGLLLGSVYASQVILIEDDSITPQYIDYACSIDKIYIPKGTIKTSFNIETEKIGEQ